MLPKSLRPLFPYLKKYRGSYIVGTICVFCNNGVWILFPLVLRRAVDDLRLGVTREKLLTYSLLLMAVAATKSIFQFLTRWILIGISREIEFDLRNDLFRHLESLSYSYYQRTRTGDIMARATNDLNAVRMLLGPAIMYSANTVVFTAGALAFMLSISPRLTIYAFLPLPVVSIVVQYFGKQIHERFEKIQAMFSEISARAQENFSGARVIRAYVQEEPGIAAFETSNREYINRSLKLVRLMGMLWPTLETMLGLAIVLVLWLGGREVLFGRITVGGFVAFNTYMVQLTWPVIALGWVINIFLLLLNFTYPRAPLLPAFNLPIPAGSLLALLGPTASGKTTLLSLTPRIYHASPASLWIDGQPVRDYPLQSLRRQIGFVPQETFLFSETVRENIAFGKEDATDQEVRSAADAANIAHDIEEFPDQYQTLVGERGITLSGGQKQRTAIARALIRNPRILILDDALSSVDTHTEDKILNHLREIMQDRTTIFISHRVSTVRNADMIAVLHAGRIVELGTHDELLARNGYYSDLYNKQLLEEELAEV